MTDATAVPVNLYENDRELIVAAPMPGVAPEDIHVEITAERRLVLRARQHGPGQERIDYLVREWSYGPFERAIELPRDVDAPRANLSYGNGVLMLSLPKSDRTVPASLRVDRKGHARGMVTHHAGRQPDDREAHQQVVDRER
ncbi:MAG: Hsp20/alpha crystallin family protein [Candidatus Limnocylindria bacterium]